ncbi:hypothetical protein GCM10009750_19410 [Agromyces salentinus]|uniref:Thioredoxin domain-containing protein n=2 Tax=Agromyces salentinus TaxID=269421 RepID=A0ABN2MQI5_9MICO
MLALVAIAVSGCTTGSPGAAAGTGAPSEAASSEAPAPAPSAESDADADVPGDGSSPATEDAASPGAYVDYTDGAIESTPGAKVLFFHASWCPNCRALDEQLRSEGAPEGLTVFKVDYDDRTDLRQQYGVTIQTTVVFVDDRGDAISSTVLYDDPSIESLIAAIP